MNMLYMMEYSEANGYTKVRVDHIIVNTWQYTVSYFKYSPNEFACFIRDSNNHIVSTHGDRTCDLLSAWVNAQSVTTIVPVNNA